MEITDTEDNREINIDVEKSDNVEFQRYASDVKEINIKFYMALCGYRLATQREQATILNQSITYENNIYVRDKNRPRYCNEACADMLSNSIWGLTSHITQLGNLTEYQIFDLWDTLMESIITSLLQNYYKEDNTYDLNIDNLDFIIAYCISYSPFTRKATKQAFLNAITQTIMALFTTKQGGEPTEKKSMFDFLKMK